MNAPMNAIKVSSSLSQEAAALVTAGGKEVRQGLTLAMVGMIALSLVGLIGLVLAGHEGARLIQLLGPEAQNLVQQAAPFAVPAALLAFLLVLLGHWRCLAYTPEGDGSARDQLSAGLLCLLTVPACFAVGHAIGGSGNYAILRGAGTLATVELFQPATLLQLTGLGVAVLSLFLFSGFIRALARDLRDADLAKSILWYTWAVAILLGGTAGVLLGVNRAAWPGALHMLAKGWLLTMFLHALVLRSAVRSLSNTLQFERSPNSLPFPVPEGDEDRKRGQVVLRAATYLHGRR